MLRQLYIAAILVLCMTPALTAQDLKGDQNMVVYDPLFWKERLKLDNNQCLRIREINSIFYKKLTDVASETNHQLIRAKAAQTLLERSEDIWETFHPRQRRIWKRIAQETAI